MRIITVSREFGSGGRELGKRLADNLGINYYDKEIISAIAKEYGMDNHYVENKLNSGYVRSYPFTFRRTFGISPAANATSELLVMQKQVIESIAEKGEDFVIVGRNADIVLEKYNPFNIFVHADIAVRINRCVERAENHELSVKEIEKHIKAIDSGRSRARELLSGTKWGDKENYHLTVNTTNRNIKELVPAVRGFVDSYFGRTV